MAHSAGNHAEPDLNSNEMAAELGVILPLLPLALPAASPAPHPRLAGMGSAVQSRPGLQSCSVGSE